MTERARAKINLYLEITGKRDDGYHEIVSVMQSVSLADTVTCDRGTEISVVCDDPNVPNDRTNLAFRAAETFFRETGISGGTRIRIEKRIPVAAGLAGGSTDAAAVLRGLDRLYGTNLSDERLAEIGKTLGADVPFCIAGGTALASGIGERLRKLPPLTDCFFVIAKGKAGVSTAWAYAALDRKFGDFRTSNGQNESGKFCGGRSVAEMEAALGEKDNETVFANLYNIFEEVVSEENQEVTRIRQALTKHGATHTLMSGSGPSVFGVFGERSDAERAAAALRETGIFAETCVPDA